MKSSHRILGVLLTGGAAMAVLDGCKPKTAAPPGDPCAALKEARTKLLDGAVRRFNHRERQIDRFLDRVRIADYLDEVIRQRGCAPEEVAPAGGGNGLVTPPAVVNKSIHPSYSTLAMQEAIGDKIKGLTRDDREIAACHLRQEACDPKSELAKSTTMLDATLASDPKTIHEDDNRIGWPTPDENKRRVALGTVALFIDKGWTEKDGQWQTGTVQSLGATFGLCGGERFIKEPSASYCSGAFVGPEWVATARHCLDGHEVAEIRVVTGYQQAQVAAGGTTRLQFPKAAVYRVVDASRQSREGEDWALLRVDRPAASDVVPLVLDTAKVVVDAPRYLAVSGHPLGLPWKYADQARVIDVGASNESNLLYWATLDTYAGNSGSPIVDVETQNVVGILVRGDADFVLDVERRCSVSKVCRGYGDCKGEVVQRVSTASFLAAVKTIQPALPTKNSPAAPAVSVTPVESTKPEKKPRRAAPAK